MDKRLRHGHVRGGRQTPTYMSWRSMHERCNNPKVINFAQYGGAGVRVCGRWESFENFLADMGERPPGTTLDRRDNRIGYVPGNCRWATGKEQQRNTSRTRHVDYRGQVRPLGDWADEFGIAPEVVRLRLWRGWDAIRALETPVRSHSADSSSASTR